MFVERQLGFCVYALRQARTQVDDITVALSIAMRRHVWLIVSVAESIPDFWTSPVTTAGLPLAGQARYTLGYAAGLSLITALLFGLALMLVTSIVARTRIARIIKPLKVLADEFAAAARVGDVASKMFSTVKDRPVVVTVAQAELMREHNGFASPTCEHLAVG